MRLLVWPMNTWVILPSLGHWPSGGGNLAVLGISVWKCHWNPCKLKIWCRNSSVSFTPRSYIAKQSCKAHHLSLQLHQLTSQNTVSEGVISRDLRVRCQHKTDQSSSNSNMVELNTLTVSSHWDVLKVVFKYSTWFLQLQDHSCSLILEKCLVNTPHSLSIAQLALEIKYTHSVPPAQQ